MAEASAEAQLEAAQATVLQQAATQQQLQAQVEQLTKERDVSHSLPAPACMTTRPREAFAAERGGVARLQQLELARPRCAAALPGAPLTRCRCVRALALAQEARSDAEALRASADAGGAARIRELEALCLRKSNEVVQQGEKNLQLQQRLEKLRAAHGEQKKELASLRAELVSGIAGDGADASLYTHVPLRELLRLRTTPVATEPNKGVQKAPKARKGVMSTEGGKESPTDGGYEDDFEAEEGAGGGAGTGQGKGQPDAHGEGKDDAAGAGGGKGGVDGAVRSIVEADRQIKALKARNLKLQKHVRGRRRRRAAHLLAVAVASAVAPAVAPADDAPVDRSYRSNGSRISLSRWVRRCRSSTTPRRARRTRRAACGTRRRSGGARRTRSRAPWTRWRRSASTSRS